MSAPAPQQSAIILRKEYKDLEKSTEHTRYFCAGPEEDDIYRWNVCVYGPPDTPYEGGLFKATLIFPHEYPLRPPVMKFTSQMWHPNIESDGKVCISILHEPGEDQYGYERPEERWTPVHSISSIIMSVISLLSSPNIDSPANVDAAKEYREDRAAFNKRVAATVRKSQDEDL